MVQILRVALLGDGERSFGQAGFNRHHSLCIFGGLRLGLAREHEYLVHVVYILLALLDGLCVGAGVVIALRQAQSTGAEVADDLARVCKILAGAHAEKGVDADIVQAAPAKRAIQLTI